MNGREPEKVLVLGDDMRIFLSVVRSLGRAGKEVHAAPSNWHSPALKSKYIAAAHYFPRYSDNPAAWRAALLATLGKGSFNLVVPCDDPAIHPLHTHRQELAGYPIAIPSPLVMKLLFDKQCTRELCIELEVPVTPGARISANDTAKKLIGRFGLPLVIKSRQSYWIDRLDVMDKASIVESELELEAVLQALTNPSRHLAEGFFSGVGVGVSVLAQHGRILHVFQHRRLREGRAGPSSYRISERVNEELYRACEKICGHTKLTGVCMFEFRYNLETRKWVLIETNARFWGSLPLPLSLGLDFPRLLYDLLVHRTRHAPIDYPAGIRARNLLLDGFNLLASARTLRQEAIGAWMSHLGDFLTQPVRWLTGRERSDTFVMDDPWPGLWECVTLPRNIGQKLTRGRNSKPNRRYSDRAEVSRHDKPDIARKIL